MQVDGTPEDQAVPKWAAFFDFLNFFGQMLR
jgi:hypothetical protein